jgi:hypothetical protein
MAYEQLWQNETWRKAFLRWWDEDWSWDGLKTKYRQASLGDDPDSSLGTLQDVWREEGAQGRLIEFGGRKWTRFHLPPFDHDGKPCRSALWNDAKDASCRAALRACLDSVKAPDKEVLEKYGLDAVTDFANLRGVVFPEEFQFDGETIIADLESALFIGDWRFSNRVLARFDKATFSWDAQFEGATFSGNAEFVSATFSGNAWFTTAMFSRDARFYYATFSWDAWFGSATFTGNAGFESATFSRVASFHGATFSGYAWFGSATFSGSAWFGGATFTEGALFESVTFTGNVGFVDATFTEDAEFESATFSRDAGFDRATFSGDARFDRATFSGSARFGRATFFRGARFGGTTPFAKTVGFNSARFRRSVDFSGREFKQRTNFSGARFGGVAKFHGAKLHPDTTFLNAEFPGERCAVPPLRRWWFADEDRKFSRVAFARWKRWRGRIGPRWWRSRPWKALRYCGVPFALRWDRNLKNMRRKRDSDAEKYEIAYRRLRRLAAEIGSIEYEGRFHALELKAHRARTDTQFLARVASWLYEILSDYGRSMGRPIAWLAGFWVAFALVYRWVFVPPYRVDAAGLAAGTCQTIANPPAWSDAIVTAAHQFLPSLFGMSSAANRPEWLRCAEASRPLAFLLASGIQIIVFLVCISLFLIALRRRFQLRD